jgi:hypothetical protein
MFARQELVGGRVERSTRRTQFCAGSGEKGCAVGLPLSLPETTGIHFLHAATSSTVMGFQRDARYRLNP